MRLKELKDWLKIFSYPDDAINQTLHTYSSSDNCGLPVPVSDWLIFCCGNLMIDKKIQILWWNTTKIPKKDMKAKERILLFEFVPLTHDVTCNFRETGYIKALSFCYILTLDQKVQLPLKGISKNVCYNLFWKSRYQKNDQTISF